MAGYRGSFMLKSDAALGTAGNVVKPQNALVGTGKGSWHPTVIYLLVLLVVEWVAFVCLAKFI